jgi:hypothetical protein
MNSQLIRLDKNIANNIDLIIAGNVRFAGKALFKKSRNFVQ